jgi:hypothetical protein
LRFTFRSLYAANKWRSAVSAHWFHLDASRPHVALLSGDLATLAIAWQFAAKLRNVSGVVISHTPNNETQRRKD